MPHYALRDDLSFCRVGEQLVFLDVGADRYFRLPAELQRALLAYLEQPCSSSDAEIGGLVARGLLVERSTTASHSRPVITPVARSAMETATAMHRPRLLDTIEVLATVLATRRALQRYPLRRVLASLAAGAPRQRKHGQSTFALEQRLANATRRYLRARLWVPVEMRCLLDSLALAKFLRRRQLDAQIVFGVALNPFSAHCWVQAGDLVLNDTVGNVHAHTPIRVV
ncbi:lasso peptide biosynthesis B2 protein [Xanthomonas cannabis]|uniref:lasso peptide biosynthesis B2 protein n=1 Tax=Xanthomonas cannabis TaxID=1885674 RepID=UPI00141B54F8|nr:lasso peptide biosynthesis B2 protein [Xanthomonas cannabis]NIK18652.1 hypothetical protein [Xanthomonas cannabis]